jgi:hypothetical protein
MIVAESETVLQMRLPLEGGGRCVRGLDGDHQPLHALDRRPSRWTHRVGVTGWSTRQTPPPDAPNKLAPYGTIRGVDRSKQAVLTRGASSSPLQGEAVAFGAQP